MEPGAQTTIDEETCWQLLRGAWLGRLALCVRALPTILPVEYRVDGDEIVICLGQHRVADRSVNNTVVGFAADMVDDTTRAGWTVQVQGRTRSLQPQDVPTKCGQHEHGQVLNLEPVTIAGQLLRLCPFESGVPESAGL